MNDKYFRNRIEKSPLGSMGLDLLNMNCKDLARNIKNSYNDLKKDEICKVFNVTSEIVVENDASFKAIIIGNTNGMSKLRGYMYLFYTNDRAVRFPSIKEIERRLKMVANKEIITDEDADYFDWDEYGSLELQREYFSEIILEALNKE